MGAFSLGSSHIIYEKNVAVKGCPIDDFRHEYRNVREGGSEAKASLRNDVKKNKQEQEVPGARQRIKHTLHCTNQLFSVKKTYQSPLF